MSLEIFRVWISFWCLYLVGKSAGFEVLRILNLEPEVFHIAKRTLSIALYSDYFVSVILV